MRGQRQRKAWSIIIFSSLATPCALLRNGDVEHDKCACFIVLSAPALSLYVVSDNFVSEVRHYTTGWVLVSAFTHVWAYLLELLVSKINYHQSPNHLWLWKLYQRKVRKKKPQCASWAHYKCHARWKLHREGQSIYQRTKRQLFKTTPTRDSSCCVRVVPCAISRLVVHW